jgi:hypothetical protein
MFLLCKIIIAYTSKDGSSSLFLFPNENKAEKEREMQKKQKTKEKSDTLRKDCCGCCAFTVLQLQVCVAPHTV